MNNANFQYNKPANEPIFHYKPGSLERKKLIEELNRLSSEQIDIPIIINGKEIRSGNTGKVINPGSGEVLATYHKAGKEEVQKAINSAINAHKIWSGLSWVERMSINLKAAELIS
ncbi:MAG: aldehyde dehydrogenase family protein, partial [Bacteroidales bacterium]|nr:aldehyde dehydrogenase family protein [Bacteroidales bacterium]